MTLIYWPSQAYNKKPERRGNIVFIIIQFMIHGDIGQTISIPMEIIRLLAVLIFPLFAFCNGFKIQPRVLNGDISNPADYPFYVLLEHNGNVGCGGSLLSERYFFSSIYG